MHKIKFPLILSGPIIRRVEPTGVYIWIATSKRYQIEEILYEIDFDETIKYQKIQTQSETKTVRIGKQLFINLIKVCHSSGAFPTDTLLGYNLRFKKDSKSEDFESLGLLSIENPQSIIYDHLKYPTFQIKGEKNECNILYGSCRKLHGAGDDTLAIADSIMRVECLNLKKQPDSLFLMGDQIYADDVADPIIRVLSTLGQELMGQSEPLHKIEERLQLDPFSTSIKQINGRQFIMENFCQFTSSQAQNHLIELGEFAAMYLHSWGPQLWEIAQAHELFDSFKNAATNNHIHFVFPGEVRFAKESKAEQTQLENRYNLQQEALISFQSTLYQVRRLFANIPTYMIFDDHDITDDWNISANWKKNVWQAPLGRHIIANGLAAYWAFQGFGNDPDSFEDNFFQEMESYFSSLMDGKIDSSLHKNWMEQMWNFDSWHFIAPTHPKAVFLNTRTQRDYDSGPKPVKLGHIIEETSSCAQLINENGWEGITNKLLTSGWKRNSPLIIVSATPVYGMGLIESFLHDYVYPLRVLGVEVQTSFDFEAWKYNGKGFTEFLQHVANWAPHSCIILSGDVHYASSVKAAVTLYDGRELLINQYTSSPLKNMSFSGVWGLLMKVVIGLNSSNRKNKEIQRYCSKAFNIFHINHDEVEQPYLWKDKLAYQFLEKGSIIETNNNLGLVSISPHDTLNTLLKNNTPI